MTWFTKLTGIDEQSPDGVRRQISVDGEHIVCPDGRQLAFGRLETPKLSELRQRVASLEAEPRRSTVREVVGDVRSLHADPANAGALFQVASQFNLLEMIGPDVTPERGVGIYENDSTQGPACAIACGAGTIYRNYFADVDGQIGQTADKQIDCSADLGRELGNTNRRLWTMQNGYLFPSDDGLAEISERLRAADEAERDALLGQLRIGLQLDAEVTLEGANHRVSQAYCSALPVAYGRQPTDQWAEFAQLVLNAAYEATLAAAVVGAARTGNRIVYLTLLGGGVFGNRDQWIIDAIERAFQTYRNHGLDVRIVSYRYSNSAIAGLLDRID
ncbi:hypothetical protein [Allorhodopirellula heiligendammensis]|uniref:Uncharacterized protein n=1 Tax=Allorhodopirellula heiligendammensis TaxID=2714739 RepID=A0A5C6C5Y8_9BACT|nr:hypothetical protein [Allorhodopirellula heiligendammensis]TWU18856.1 hypothetical protein Poly21_10230 [Allorhodopirellula heiligendammensis]